MDRAHGRKWASRAPARPRAAATMPDPTKRKGSDSDLILEARVLMKRVNGKQHWKSFKSLPAQLYLAQAQAKNCVASWRAR